MLHNALVRTSPRALRRGTHPFDRLFSGDFLAPFAALDEGLAPASGYKVPVDVVETEDGYEFTADLPGLTKKDVQITLDNNVLTLSGERSAREEKEENTVRRTERLHGRFSRSFRLPYRVSGEEAKARFKNGVLTLTVPKAPDAKARTIEIH